MHSVRISNSHVKNLLPPPVLLLIHCKHFIILTLAGVLILAGAAGFVLGGMAHAADAPGGASQPPEQETWQMRALHLIGEDTEDGRKAAMELLQEKAESGDARAQAAVGLQTYLAKGREQRKSEDLEQLEAEANKGLLEAMEAYLVCNFGMPENEDKMKQLADKAVEHKSVIGFIVQRYLARDESNVDVFDEVYEESGFKAAGKEVKKRIKKSYPNWAWASLKQGCRPLLKKVGEELGLAPSGEVWGCEKEGIEYLDTAAQQGSFNALQTFLSIAEALAIYPNRLKEVTQYMKYASLVDNFDPPGLDNQRKGYDEEYVAELMSHLETIKGHSEDNAVGKAADEQMRVLKKIAERMNMDANENHPGVDDDAWLRKAAESGSPTAVKILGEQLLADPGKASEYKKIMEKALKHKAWNAAYYLGHSCASGANGAKDPKKAFEYYCVSRDHAGVKASYAVVHSYLFGIGTTKSVKKARLALRTMLWNALDSYSMPVTRAIDGGTLAKMLTAHILLGKDAKK